MGLIERSKVKSFPNINTEDNDRTVKIKVPIYEKLAEHAKEQDKSLRGHINDQLATKIAKYEISKKLRPNLTLLATDDNSLFIRDSKAEKLVEVRLAYVSHTEDTLQPICIQDDKSEDCIHVAFVWGLFEQGLLDKLSYGSSG